MYDQTHKTSTRVHGLGLFKVLCLAACDARWDKQELKGALKLTSRRCADKTFQPLESSLCIQRCRISLREKADWMEAAPVFLCMSNTLYSSVCTLAELHRPRPKSTSKYSSHMLATWQEQASNCSLKNPQQQIACFQAARPGIVGEMPEQINLSLQTGKFAVKHQNYMV